MEEGFCLKAMRGLHDKMGTKKRDTYYLSLL
jgi:hypothetical protein